jgi:outer membrane lipase/esterase
VPEIERETASVRVSVDGALQPGFVIGLQAHASHSTAEAGALAFEGDSVGLDAYLGAERGPLFLNFVVGGSSDEYTDYRRVTAVGPIQHSADRVAGSSLSGKLQAGFRIPLGAAELSPRAAVSAMRVNVEAFNENGPAARHAVREHDIEAAAGEASVRLETPLVGGGRFRWHIEGGYGDFFDYDGDIAVALANNPAKPIGTELDAPGRGAILKAGLHGEIFEGVRLGLGYQGRFDDAHDSHTARLTISYRPGG